MSFYKFAFAGRPLVGYVIKSLVLWKLCDSYLYEPWRPIQSVHYRLATLSQKNDNKKIDHLSTFIHGPHHVCFAWQFHTFVRCTLTSAKVFNDPYTAYYYLNRLNVSKQCHNTVCRFPVLFFLSLFVHGRTQINLLLIILYYHQIRNDFAFLLCRVLCCVPLCLTWLVFMQQLHSYNITINITTSLAFYCITWHTTLYSVCAHLVFPSVLPLPWEHNIIELNIYITHSPSNTLLIILP